jgi:hypothetical protein
MIGLYQHLVAEVVDSAKKKDETEEEEETKTNRIEEVIPLCLIN